MTNAETRTLIAQLADESFAEHRLTQHRDWVWRVGREKSWVYGYYVSFVPGSIIVTGDIGSSIIKTHTNEAGSLEWLRGSCHDSPYMFGKLEHQTAFREFYPDDVIAWCTQYITELETEGADSPSSITRMRDLLHEVHTRRRYHEFSEHAWYELARDAGLDDVWTIGQGWSSDAYWHYHALKTFMTLHDAAEAQA